MTSSGYHANPVSEKVLELTFDYTLGEAMKKLLLVLLPSLVLTACSSTFKTSKFDPANWQPVGEQVEGLVYYDPHQVLVTYVFTALTDKGNLVGTADNNSCAPIIQKQEIVVEPNFGEPRVLLNQPSPFSTSKLSVTLSNGMITNINSESSPRTPEFIKEVTGFFKEAGLLPLMKKADLLPACNAAPVIRSKVPFAPK